MPGAHEVVGQILGEVYAEEARQIRPIVLRCRPHQRLHEEERGHDQKEPAHARCAGVSATSPGLRNDSVACSRPRQPRKFHRPKAANRSPMPPRSAIRESTLHTTMLAVGSFSTSGSGGQLLV